MGDDWGSLSLAVSLTVDFLWTSTPLHQLDHMTIKKPCDSLTGTVLLSHVSGVKILLENKNLNVTNCIWCILVQKPSSTGFETMTDFSLQFRVCALAKIPLQLHF